MVHWRDRKKRQKHKLQSVEEEKVKYFLQQKWREITIESERHMSIAAVRNSCVRERNFAE